MGLFDAVGVQYRKTNDSIDYWVKPVDQQKAYHEKAKEIYLDKNLSDGRKVARLDRLDRDVGILAKKGYQDSWVVGGSG